MCEKHPEIAQGVSHFDKRCYHNPKEFEICDFFCAHGYSLDGLNRNFSTGSIKCTNSGEWTQPKCIPIAVKTNVNKTFSQAIDIYMSQHKPPCGPFSSDPLLIQDCDLSNNFCRVKCNSGCSIDPIFKETAFLKCKNGTWVLMLTVPENWELAGTIISGGLSCREKMIAPPAKVEEMSVCVVVPKNDAIYYCVQRVWLSRGELLEIIKIFCVFRYKLKLYKIYPNSML